MHVTVAIVTVSQQCFSVPENMLSVHCYKCHQNYSAITDLCLFRVCNPGRGMYMWWSKKSSQCMAWGSRTLPTSILTQCLEWNVPLLRWEANYIQPGKKIATFTRHCSLSKQLLNASVQFTRMCPYIASIAPSTSCGCCIKTTAGVC